MTAPSTTLEWLEAVRAELVLVKAERDRYAGLVGAAYQLAGLVGAPEKWLDALSLSNDAYGDDLLPVFLDDLDEFRKLKGSQ